MSPSNPTTSVGDTLTNGLETYVVLERIGIGKTSIVYRVICKSGRLRNRHLALKKVSSVSARPHSNKSPSIHLALHHPNIVSMFSAFYTPSDNFHILEFCSEGSILEFLLSRTPSTLLETELRGVMKSLLDALVYLKKESIIHCNIVPAKILLTNDYGVKLSGFELAIRRQDIGSTVSDSIISRHSGHPQYLAPEIISGRSLSFAVDVWSLGCVMLASLSGTPPFDGNTIPDIFDMISQVEYTFPLDISTELKNLIKSILQFKPEDRLSLPDILSHPFLAPNLTVKSLRLIQNVASRNAIEETSCELERCQPVKLAPFPPKPVKLQRPARHSSVYPLRAPSAARSVLRDIANTDLKNLLYNKITTDLKSPHTTGPTRRIVSDPIPRSTSAKLGTHSNHRSLSVPGFPTSSSIAVNANDEDTRSNLSRPNTPLLDTDHGSPEATDTARRQTPSCTFAGIPMSSTSLPIGTTRPRKLNTLGLNSQTHKTTYGQITILPSRALLVDFRESQRRRGFRSDEVLLIDSDGNKISVYSAPHLSAPCCLVEPIQQFSVANLPSTYWKQYNDAGRLIDQIKQRTPKLVVYTVAAKCTLMANIPRGDIELSFTSPTITSTKSPRQRQDKSPYMRIRFSRQGQFMELSQHISGAQGEEWTKKSISSTESPPYISIGNWKTLEDTEKVAIQQLVHFVRTCEAVEELLVLDELPMPQMDSMPRADSNFKPPTPQPWAQPLKTNVAYPRPIVANSLSSVKLAQRPAKLSTSSTVWSIQDEGRIDSSKLSNLSREDDAVENIRSTLNAIDPTEWCVEEFTSGSRGIQTRFLPSIGWCIRYGSRVSQGGRYRIMFLDGISLDIDVDEDWAELTSRPGVATRFRIRDCGSDKKMGERMKVFEEFISLFDDSQNE